MTLAPAAPTPSSIYASYRDAVREAVQQQPKAWTFKRDEGYREILEHVSRDQGTAFLNWALAAQTDLERDLVVRIATLNDSLGKPIQFHYPGLGRFSPSNWRYLCHALKVWQHIESFGLPEMNVVELGGGYGGLALFIHGLRDMFTTRLGTYTLVDIPEAALLQGMFLLSCDVPARVANGLDDEAIRGALSRSQQPFFFVSAYAFSEFDQGTRDWYAERVIRYCEHGLIIWNCPEPIRDHFGRELGGAVYPFIDKPLSIEPDLPNLYIGHKLVRW